MPDRRDIPDALRDAVERTVQATVGTRELAQGAASELSASVDELVKGAEKGLTRSRRSVRAAVGERLPATQDDVKAIRAELRHIGERLDAIEGRLADPPATARRGSTTRAKASSKTKPAAKGKAAPRKAGTAAKGRTKSAGASKAKSRSSSRAGTRAKPQR